MRPIDVADSNYLEYSSVNTQLYAPTAPKVGEMYYCHVTGHFMIYDGRAWVAAMDNMFQSNGVDDNSDSELCDKHEGLAELKSQLDEAKEKYEAYKALVK